MLVIFQIYRLHVIWTGNLLITVLPILTWFSSIGELFNSELYVRKPTKPSSATGIGLLVESSKPGGALGQSGLISFGTPFYVLSISLNVLCTVLIAGKLWYHHRKMSKYDFASNHGYYMAIAMIIIESSALYSVVGIIYIPLFVLNLSLSFVFSPLLGSAAVGNLSDIPVQMCLNFMLRLLHQH